MSRRTSRAWRRKWREKVVREERLELSRIAPLDPKSSAYASFATLAGKSHILQGDEFNTGSPCRQEEERSPGGLRRGVFPCRGRMFSLFCTGARSLRSSVMRRSAGGNVRPIRSPGQALPHERERGKKGPPEEVPAGLFEGCAVTTRHKADASASPSWERRA